MQQDRFYFSEMCFSCIYLHTCRIHGYLFNFLACINHRSAFSICLFMRISVRRGVYLHVDERFLGTVANLMGVGLLVTK